MLKEERQRQILDILGDRGRVVAAELAELLGTSEDTIRRDLRELSAAGLLQRVHGGALQRTTTPLAYTARVGRAPQAKAALAKGCIGLLRAGQVIILDGGTTAEQVAHHVPGDLEATVITNSPNVAIALAEHPHIDVIMPSGRMFKATHTLVGASTVAFFRTVRADICVLGVASVHPQFGVSVLDYEESLVKRAMMQAAHEAVVLADADKLGKAASFVVGELAEFTCLVTERSVGEEGLRPYREATRVLVV